MLIAVTGYGTPNVDERARRAGFPHFPVEPADPDQIRAILAEYPARLAAPLPPPEPFIS